VGHGSSSLGEERSAGAAAGDPAAPGEVSEVEILRRKCAQLESSLHSQGLVQRRLEAEHQHYQTLARDELHQVYANVHRGSPL